MVKQKIFDNLSFIISIIAAGSIFFPSLLLKDKMDSVEYGEFSLLITIISIVYSFGALGSEQVLNRLAVITDGKLELNKKSLYLLVGSLMFIIPLVFLLLNLIIKHSYSSLYVVCILIFSSVGMIMYNLCRLMSKFILAQTLLNFWKFCIALAFLVTMFLELKFIDIFIFIFIPSFLFVLVLFYKEFKNYNVTYSDIGNTSVYPFFYASLINMAGITMLGYGDRFLIEHHLGIEKMGEYYYMMTIYVFPFIIFANYIGFKKLVFYKKNKNINKVKNDLLKTLSFAILLGFFVYIFWLLISIFNIWEHNSNIEYPLAFLFLGGTRLIYSVISAAVGAKALPKILLVSNIIFLSILTVFVIFYPMNTILSTIYLVIFFWILRSFLGWIVIKNSMKGELNDH